jgi:hypothetical protein
MARMTNRLLAMIAALLIMDAGAPIAQRGPAGPA